MLIPLGVASKGSKPGGQHVHQPVVSRLRHPRLRVRPHRLPGRPGDLHHPPGARDLPLLGLRLPPRSSRAARSSAASDPCPSAAGRRSWSCRSRASNVGPVALVRQVEVPFADPRRSYTKSFERYALELSRSMTIRDVARHLGVGWDVIKDIQKRDLSRRYRQAQAQAPAAHRHRRDRRRQGAPLPDGGHGPGERRGGLRRRRQGGRRAEAVLEAAAAQRGEDRGGGHGHVGGVPRGGLDPPAQGEDRLRPLPCRQALQREALRPAPGVVPRGDRRACTRRCSRGRGGCC